MCVCVCVSTSALLSIRVNRNLLERRQKPRLLRSHLKGAPSVWPRRKRGVLANPSTAHKDEDDDDDDEDDDDDDDGAASQLPLDTEQAMK